MIFALSVDDRSLHTFKDEKSAVAACEGLDVEDGVWKFWSGEGKPFQPHFDEPNTRGSLIVGNGKYHLVPAVNSLALTESVLEDVASFEGDAPLNSLEGVCAYLAATQRGRGEA